MRVPALKLGESLVKTHSRLPLQDLASQSLIEPMRGR